MTDLTYSDKVLSCFYEFKSGKSDMPDSSASVPRESLDYDVVIVGAGPAGLATALHLKQTYPQFSVVVLEKGAEVGAHILSGLVMDPIGLDALCPDWRRDAQCPLRLQVTQDHFYYLRPQHAFRLPSFLMPPLMHNHGAFVGSLGHVCRWLAQRAEALGVEIYAGFPAVDLLSDEKGSIIGVVTGDMGRGRDGQPRESFVPGMELRAKYTILAEGARGSLTKRALHQFHLAPHREPQKYGLGFKEIWRIHPDLHRPGLIQHSFGWPLDDMTGGGSFLYHLEDNQVAVGFVVHLNYKNPTLSPFDEFQRFKTHPLIASLLKDGERLSYGARALTEGGWQSVPRLTFPGGLLVGCAAGFMNVPRIKGSHNALLSGLLAADHIGNALTQGRAHDEIQTYEEAWRSSQIGQDLYPVRNVKPLWSQFGTVRGVALAGLDMWCQHLFKRSPFGTLSHKVPDEVGLNPLQEAPLLSYPKPDGVLTFDRLSSVFLSNTHHEEDQPVHLHLKNPTLPLTQNLPLYGEPARLYCPAGVYEVIYKSDPQTGKQDPHFIINAQNCIHCKTCDIKDPAQNIDWVPPEGGGGPHYGNM